MRSSRRAKLADMLRIFGEIPICEVAPTAPNAPSRPSGCSREREMIRLRNLSRFYLVEDIRISDYDTRVRISRAARRVAKRTVAFIFRIEERLDQLRFTSLFN